MTVSPTGAQRPAERTFGAEETADDPGIAADVTLLPPTLLRLPDLDRPGPTETPERSAASEQISADDFRELPPSPDQVSATAGHEPDADDLCPDSAKGTSGIPAEADQEPTHQTPKRAPHRRDAVPEGRGWMERMGSRSIALLVLLSLAATAIVAGRNGDPHPRFDAEPTRELSVTPELPQSPEARIAIKPDVDRQAAASDEYPATVTPSETETVSLSPASGVGGSRSRGQDQNPRSGNRPAPELGPSGHEDPVMTGGSPADRDAGQPARPSTEPVWDLDPHAVWNTPENAVGSPESTAGDSAAGDADDSDADAGDSEGPTAEQRKEPEAGSPAGSTATPDAKRRRGPRHSDTPEPITDWRRYLPDPQTDYIAAPPQPEMRR